MDDFAELVQKVQRLYDAGVDVRSIAAALRADGVPVPLGAAQWTAALVARVLTCARRQRARGPGRPGGGGDASSI
jgi:hypothetical protein